MSVQTQSVSVQAMACTHCREKKLRCGRERPQCANCKRDGMECGFSTPGKRVNHIKLLCDSVGDVIDRLNNVEGELSRLNIMLQSGICQNTSGEEPSDRSPTDNQPSDDTPARNPADRHAVRSEKDLEDRYHGPCSLLVLCTEFRDLILSEQRKRDLRQPGNDSPSSQKKQDTTFHDEAVQGLLTRLCLEASLEDSFDHQSDHVPIRLPPKQFLLMAQAQFFERADFTTDLFVRSSFTSNIERLYSRPFNPSDEAWAICFNTIILLVLGSENSTQHNNDPIVGSQFALPFLMTVRTALSNPQVLMAPKLINVQALALLCIASQQYYPTGLSESIFAQACMLARTMGLHQTHITPEGISAEEGEERLKVFISLYLQDKRFSISRGSLCWLPSFDCSLPSKPSQLAFADPNCFARIQLARLQEDIYQSFYSAESHTQFSTKNKSALSRIERRLKHWVHTNGVFSSSFATSHNVDLQLDFLAATIRAFRVSTDPGHVRQALDSARASCMLLLIAYGKHDQSILERLEALLLPESPSRIFSKAISPRPGGSDKHTSSDTFRQNAGESITQRPYSLLDTSSIPGIFALIKSIVCATSADAESQAEEDLDLLQRVCAAFQEFDAGSQQNHGTVNIGRVLQGLLEVVSLIKRPANPLMSVHGSNSSSNLHTSPSSEGSPDRAQSIPDFSSMLASSPYQIHSLPWNASSNKATPRMGLSPNLISPLDAQYTTQTVEPFRHQLSPTHIQHQTMPPPSRKRPYENDRDLSMDNDTELSSLSDYFFLAPEMSF